MVLSLTKNFKMLSMGILTLLSVTGCNNDKKQEGKDDKKVEPVFNTAFMDNTVNPGDDFYMYANATWKKNNPIPEQYSRFSSFEKLMEQNLNQLKEMFQTVASDKTDNNPIHKKIGDFYSCGMDTAKIEAEGINPLNDELAKIDAIKTNDDFFNTVAYFHSNGMFPLFNIFQGQDDKNSNMVIAQLNQGGLGLPDRDYYTGDDERTKEIRTEYVKHISKMMELLGSGNDFTKMAETIMKIETHLAEASMTLVAQRDPNVTYNKMKLDELLKLSKDLNWKNYFAAISLAPVDINVRQTGFFKDLPKIIKEFSVADWQLYLKWNLLNTSSSYLSKKFNDEHFKFYGTVLSGSTKQQDRWKKVLNVTSSVLGEAVGQLYVEKYFPAEAKQKMLQMVTNLKNALREHISKLAWMSDPTKKAALEKLNAINLKIGYPEKWIDYSAMDVQKDSYFKNYMRACKFNFKREIEKINKPVDRTLWGMTPQTINAYYDPSMNEIVFPAAILQPPFFNMNADDAVNYGAIGAVIGHEMTHGFDDQGRQYDKEGNLKDWWTKIDSDNFSKQVDVLVVQYDAYKVLDSLHINGKLTLGENIADMGGVTVSLTALKNSLKDKTAEKIDGFTPIQRFFLAYAQVWKLNIRDKELMRRIKEDVHSPGDARVNGIVYNVPDFYEAFGIKEGKRVKPENERARIW